jgi:hypothetical protein
VFYLRAGFETAAECSSYETRSMLSRDAQIYELTLSLNDLETYQMEMRYPLTRISANFISTPWRKYQRA